jgi:hypothetical protein
MRLFKQKADGFDKRQPRLRVPKPDWILADMTNRFTESVVEEAALGWLEGQALVRLNPSLPPEALPDAFRKLMRTERLTGVPQSRSKRAWKKRRYLGS